MAIRFFIIVFLCVSLRAFSQNNQSNSSLQNSTEASFNFECSQCKKQGAFKFLSENQECLKIISAKECRGLPREEKKTCSESDEIQQSDIKSLFKQCAEGIASSYVFIFDLLLYAINNSVSWLFSSEQDTEDSSAESYIFIEFYKVYSNAKGSQLERALEAALVVGGQAFDTIWSTVTDFLHTKYKVLRCYNSRIQFAMTCSFILGMLLPIPAGGVVTALKTGAKIGTTGIKVGTATIGNPKTLKSVVAKKIQLRSFVDDMKLHFDNLKGRVMNASKNLPKRQKKEIQTFFQNVNREQFMSSMNGFLSKNLSAGQLVNRERIKDALTLALTTGAINTVRLSPRSATIVTENLVNTLATEYVHESVIFDHSP